MWCVFIILGIVAEILKANAILVIPTIVEYILFGVGGLLLVIKFIILVLNASTLKSLLILVLFYIFHKEWILY